MNGNSDSGHPSFDASIEALNQLDRTDAEIGRIVRNNDRTGAPLTVDALASTLTELGITIETWSQIADRVDRLVALGLLDNRGGDVSLGLCGPVLGVVT